MSKCDFRRKDGKPKIFTEIIKKNVPKSDKNYKSTYAKISSKFI